MTHESVVNRWYSTNNKTPQAAAVIAWHRAELHGRIDGSTEDEYYELWNDVISQAKAAKNEAYLDWLVQFVSCMKQRETPEQEYLFGMCLREEWNCLPLSD